MIKVMFVCMGNICRSPAAEGIFRSHVRRHGLDENFSIQSSGTGGWHVGSLPDSRMRSAALQRGFKLDSKAQQFVAKHFDEFDLILTMDEHNYQHVKAMAKNPDQLRKIKKFVSFCRVHSVDEVPDPYHGAADGFELVLDILDDGCSELLAQLEKDVKNGR